MTRFAAIVLLALVGCSEPQRPAACAAARAVLSAAQAAVEAACTQQKRCAEDPDAVDE